MARFHLGVMDEKLTKEVWAAENRRIEGNMLVTLDLTRGEADSRFVENYKSALLDLKKASQRFQGISYCALLLTTDTQLEAVFQILVNNFGTKHHSFAVTELPSGEGLGYNAKEQVVYEVYPTR